MNSATAQLTCDVLVIGSGAAGLSAAISAASAGLSVVMVEKEPQFGGTSAWSNGLMWLPNSHLSPEVDANAARKYLQSELGEYFNAELIDAYLHAAPKMVSFFEANTEVRLSSVAEVPDIHSYSIGASGGGRTLAALSVEGDILGDYFQLLKRPLKETTIFGMGIAPGTDLAHFYNAAQSWRSFKYVATRLGKHIASRLKDGRGNYLVKGNALVARLAASAIKLGVDLRVSHPVRGLISEHGRVTGANILSGSGELRITTKKAVILATGGFAHDNQRKRELLPHTHTGEAHWSAASRGNTGDGLKLGEEIGAEVIAERSAAALTPVSLVPRGDGTFTHFPHLFERGKPGVVAVNRAGKRFTNEANSCFDFMNDLLNLGLTESWLICDHRFIRRWGLGAVKPAPMPFQIGHYIHNGYLVRANTIEALAQSAVIDPNGLETTVAQYNLQATIGQDDEFHKGQTVYDQKQGDKTHGPNPCMAPILQAPFYALKLLPGSLGTFAGLHTNEFAQVLQHDDQPIDGLYAVGNDMASVMAGHYPSDGIALGQAMVFGYIAGNHIAGRELT